MVCVVVGVVPIIPPFSMCAVVPVGDCGPMVVPELMLSCPAPVGIVAPGVARLTVVGGEVVIPPDAPEAPDLTGPELIRRDWATTRRVSAAPVMVGVELELGPVVALPSATRGRPPASARVPSPDSTAHAAPTATTTSRAAETIKSIMCLDRFTVFTSLQILVSLCAGRSPLKSHSPIAHKRQRRDGCNQYDARPA